MVDPSLVLQASIIAALNAITDLGASVYEEPPATARYPYVTVTGIDLLDDTAGDYQGSIASVTIHICTDTPGATEARTIGKKVISALDASLEVEGFEVIIHEMMSARYGPIPDSPARGQIIQRYELAPAV